MSKITCMANGPFLVDGVSEVVDASGRSFDLQGKTRVALCRCATSRNKPFCDGSHKASFRVDDVAPRKA
ncbi:MAG: CDGSH iron-sulfur domain-containing protein [Deltaproteobacteria bacterium]|nr:CDGSH iron-sulfur domain-containing protein [Deltaproteobacteria bacterium]